MSHVQALNQDPRKRPESPISEDINSFAVFIPDANARERVTNLASFLWWAEEMSPKLETPAGLIAWRAANEIGEVVGALARHETPPLPPPWYTEYAAAWDEVEREETLPGAVELLERNREPEGMPGATKVDSAKARSD